MNMVWFDKERQLFYHHYEVGKLHKVIRDIWYLQKTAKGDFKAAPVDCWLKRGEVVVFLNDRCLEINKMGGYYYTHLSKYKTHARCHAVETLSSRGVIYVPMNTGNNHFRKYVPKEEKEKK